MGVSIDGQLPATAPPRELMHAADEAMYWVKRHGKNAYAAALSEA